MMILQLRKKIGSAIHLRYNNSFVTLCQKPVRPYPAITSAYFTITEIRENYRDRMDHFCQNCLRKADKEERNYIIQQKENYEL
jgi:hypothetical protein